MCGFQCVMCSVSCVVFSVSCLVFSVSCGVQCVMYVLQVFSCGQENRATAATNMNEHSSRSHALMCVSIVGSNKTTGAKTLGKSGKLLRNRPVQSLDCGRPIHNLGLLHLWMYIENLSVCVTFLYMEILHILYMEILHILYMEILHIV